MGRRMCVRKRAATRTLLRIWKLFTLLTFCESLLGKTHVLIGLNRPSKVQVCIVSYVKIHQLLSVAVLSSTSILW